MKRKKNSNRRWMGWGLALLVIGIGVAVMGWAYIHREWRGKERFTLIKTDGEMKIESFDPVTKKGSRIKLPQKLEIATVAGRGEWRVEALVELAKKYGWRWVGDSIGDALGVEITGIDQELGVWDKLQWMQYYPMVDWKDIDLEGFPYSRSAVSVDGDKYLILEDRWAQYSHELFSSMAIINEGISVVVINSIGAPGLGNHAARVIENVGMRVVMINNDWQGDSQKCQLTTNEKNLNSVSLNYLKQVFECNQVVVKTDNSDIIIRLGNEYLDWWMGK